jgi:phage terminase Nu1 subunit (DNA packaging protein)
LRKVAAGRSGITDERLQLVREQRDKLALANAATRGESVKLIEVIRVWSDTFRGVSAKLLAIPDRLASRLPNLSRHDLHEIDQEIRIVLTETAEGYDPAKDHATGNTPVTNPKEENDNDEKAKKD